MEIGKSFRLRIAYEAGRRSSPDCSPALISKCEISRLNSRITTPVRPSEIEFVYLRTIFQPYFVWQVS